MSAVSSTQIYGRYSFTTPPTVGDEFAHRAVYNKFTPSQKEKYR